MNHQALRTGEPSRAWHPVASACFAWAKARLRSARSGPRAADEDVGREADQQQERFDLDEPCDPFGLYRVLWLPFVWLCWEQTRGRPLERAAVFGFLIALMGCYHGYTSKGGAQGVGMATTSAVVSASMLILTFNYFLTEAFFAL